jgi:hypothetical protein
LGSADDTLREIDEHPLIVETPVDPGFVLSFVVYPRATALAYGFHHFKFTLFMFSIYDRTKGFCYVHMAQQGEQDMEVINEHLRRAAQFYEQAALLLPVDDELYACK